MGTFDVIDPLAQPGDRRLTTAFCRAPVDAFVSVVLSLLIGALRAIA